MKFYHFTSVSYAETILSMGISRGHVKHGDGSIRNSVVWLTTDPDADGHGLTTGDKTLTARAMEYLTRVDGVAPKNGIVMNKTRVRLTVEMSADTATLMPFVEYYARRGEKPDEAKLMGLSAYVENPWRLPLTRRRHLLKSTTTKEGTWWLSFAPITASEITRVEYNSPAGFVDYDFEAHGRQHFHDAGFVVPSAATLQSLHPLVPCDYPFEKAKAFAFCLDTKRVRRGDWCAGVRNEPPER